MVESKAPLGAMLLYGVDPPTPRLRRDRLLRTDRPQSSPAATGFSQATRLPLPAFVDQRRGKQLAQLMHRKRLMIHR